MKKTAINILFLVLTLSCFAQKKYYVKPDGIPGLSGNSWSWATNDLREAVEKAVAGDIVYVAAGTYYGGFVMKEGVTVMGGYTANRDNPTERNNVMDTTDPAKQSILDGKGEQRVLTQYAPFTVPTTWEGFVIQNGNPSVEFKIGNVIYSTTGDAKIAGILYKYDSATGAGMMFSVEESGKQWGGYEEAISGLPVDGTKESAGTDLAGLAHSETILSVLGDHSPDFSQEDYPLNGNYAAYWCDTLTTGGYTDWYLPSAGELQEVYDAGVKAQLKNLGKNVTEGYWTSSHAGNALAWAYYFNSGYLHPALKYVRHTAGAIHPFTTPEQPDGIYFAGGGVFLSGNGILENCIVKNNTSTSRGGGVYVGRGGNLVNCLVEGNEAPEGKEIYYETPTGIPPVKNTDFRIYPNPVKSGAQITIDLNSDKVAVDYQLVNAAGVTVMKGKWGTNENTLTVPVQKGIYILSLHSGTKNYKSKIIIN
ncbi:MAG: T9SS type A sorting domain-containing protein [Candidatus Symbiothrix sp.]|jgi:hypothetical protein|nr:T9SS type A sorting domain-containing protein [Candidatus Symbiothrix sp.]